MLPSKEIKEKIKGWEGCRLTAYRCPGGVLTIGYGHTGPDVTEGLAIDRNTADLLFEADVNTFASSVGRMLPAGLRQCQYDALVSFAYNCGTGNLKASTLLKKVKANPDAPSIRAEFMKWNKSKGKVLAGLTRRRAAEADHYFGKI